MLVLAILVGLIVMLEYLLIKYTDTPSEIAMGTLVCGMFLLLAGIVPAIIGESAAKKVASPTVIYSEVLGTKNTSLHPLNPKQIIYLDEDGVAQTIDVNQATIQGLSPNPKGEIVATLVVTEGKVGWSLTHYPITYKRSQLQIEIR